MNETIEKAIRKFFAETGIKKSNLYEHLFSFSAEMEKVGIENGFISPEDNFTAKGQQKKDMFYAAVDDVLETKF